MSLWVPPAASRELREETRRREAEALHGLRLDHQEEYRKEFNRDLERVWPGMRLVWCTDPAPVDAVAMGARPGRWGILMPSQTGGPGSVKPLVGPDGESYAEPGAWVFDMLREQDWWNPEVRRERERVQEELKRAKRKREQQEHEARVEEALERYMAGTRTQVSMNRSTPWAQNASGYRRVRGRKK